MEIDHILSVLKTTFPQIKLEEIESEQYITKIKHADYLSCNIHFERGETNKPTAYITPHSNKAESSFEPASLMIMPDKENDDKLIIQRASFSCRTNIIIDNSSFWESAQEIRIRQLKIIPVILGKTICIETMKIPNPRTFKVNMINNNQLIVNIWAYDEEIEIDISNPSNSQIIFHKNCDWTFQKYLPNRIIIFDSMPEIIISFDESIVKDSILIKCEHHIRSNEYYVLVVSH